MLSEITAGFTFGTAATFGAYCGFWGIFRMVDYVDALRRRRLKLWGWYWDEYY